jgi:hypothetical protein
MNRENRPLSADIEIVAAMIADGSLVEAIEAGVGLLAWPLRNFYRVAVPEASAVDLDWRTGL